MEEQFISNFYGTDIYMSIEKDKNPYIIARHIYNSKKEECLFDIKTCKLIKGYFSNKERYEDVGEWLNENRQELLNMWFSNKIYEIGGIL